MLTIKNWHQFQHYKDRNPSWIKLHKNLLDDYDFQCLPIASKALAPMLWLLASETNDGTLPSDLVRVAFRLRMTIEELKCAIKPLIEKGFVDDASGLLAASYQDASPEKERETETEIEYLSDATPPTRKKTYTDDFENFWSAYPTDRNMSKLEAFKHWQRLTPDDKRAASLAIPSFVDWVKTQKDYRTLHACRFISQRRFEGFLKVVDDNAAAKKSLENKYVLRTGTDQHHAWRKHLTAEKGRPFNPPDGWLVATEWPPNHNQLQAAE